MFVMFKTKNINRKYLANCHNKLSEEGTKSVSEKTISRWLNKLVELGLIAPPGRVNYIRLVVPDIDKMKSWIDEEKKEYYALSSL